MVGTVKEVHRRDGFPVIAKKGKPTFCWLRVSRLAPECWSLASTTTRFFSSRLARSFDSVERPIAENPRSRPLIRAHSERENLALPLARQAVANWRSVWQSRRCSGFRYPRFEGMAPQREAPEALAGSAQWRPGG